jgi:tetratricopeptide (TPR) repeat protein
MQTSNDNALLSQAQQLQSSGNLESAVTIYRSLVLRHEGNARLLHLAGTAELLACHYAHAIDLLKRSLVIDAGQADTHSHLGIAFWNLGDYMQAAAAYRDAIRLRPDYAEPYNNLCMVLLDGFDLPDQALAAVDRAIALVPAYADAYINRGNVLQALKRYDEAVESYRRAIELNPDFASAYNNLGNAYRNLKRFPDAISAYDAAILLRPNYADAYCNMGCTLGDLGHVEDARIFYQRSLALAPNTAKPYFNLADLAALANNHQLALECLNRSIELDPSFKTAYWNKSLLKLLMGELQEGFALYEWGWKCNFRGGDRGFQEPRWLGNTPIAGKRLLIHQEQGLGDCIHFARYVQMAVNLGAEVILEAVSSLIPLLKSLKPACEFVPLGAPLPHFDCYIPLMSLPLAFGTTLENMPPSKPYLFAESERAKIWSQRLGSQVKPRVGLVWSGSTIHKNDHNRSMPLKELLPVLSLPLEFHCLQKEIRSDDLACLEALPMIHTYDDGIKDFADTAALISLMDLVISVDTSVAHLSGAMGKPVWILLANAPDWRWFLDREDSPWYPSARLFRQDQSGSWSGVISRVRESLANMVINETANA